MKFTKTSIEQLPLPEKPGSYQIYRDDKLPGFCVRVTSNGIKTFIIDKKVNNKLRRITIGRFGILTVEQASKEAQKILGQFATGIDPWQERKNNNKNEITLQKAFDDYLLARKSLKPRTIKDYHLLLKSHLSDWRNKSLNNITKEMVTQRHAAIGKTSRCGANNAFKLISAIFNFAIYQYGDSFIQDNPVIKLSKTRAWFPTKRRRTKIELHELPAWFQAVNSMKNINQKSITDAARDYLLTLLFTGLRRNEALLLVWADRKDPDPKIAATQHLLDLKAKTLLIPDPKNHDDHLLPLPDYLIQILQKRHDSQSSIYVFPNATGKSHFKEPRKIIDKVTKLSNVSFSLHDLRRTFISIAESLDIPAYALKRLLNHKIINSDVTAGYIVSDIDRLKKPMQMVADYILQVVGNST